MIKFKLTQFLATSMVVFGISGGSAESAVVMEHAPLTVPKYRYQAKEVYNTLKNRADAGDEVAQKVLSNYKGASITTDLNLAINAATAYNRKDVTSQPAGTPPVPEAKKPEVSTPPTSTPGVDEVPELTSELKSAEAQKPAPADTGMVGKYKALAERCIADVGKLEAENKALKSALESAKHCPEAGGKVSSEQQKIYDELDQFLKSDPQLQYKKIKELLESLLAENDSESAITKFLGVVTKYQSSDARGEKVSTIYIKLNEEGILKDYFLSMMRKELRVAQETIFPDGLKTLEALPPQANVDFLVQNPLLMICYTDKDKAKGFWINNLKTYNQFINSTKPEYLKAVYTFLIKRWKVLHALDVVSTTPMQAFLISIYERIESHKSPENLKMPKAQVQRFIEDRIKNDLPTDFKKLEADNMQYASEFKSINVQKEMSRNPFLKILDVKDFDQWSKYGFERSAYDKMISFLAFCNLTELKAILYHLSKLGFATGGDLNEQYFYKAVNEQVKSRDAKKQQGAPQTITNTTKTEMNTVVSKIASGN